MPTIDTNFESGSVEFVSFDETQKNLSLHLIKNQKGKTNHWFYFKVTNVYDDFTIFIHNANESIFKNGWKGYYPFISYDGVCWERYDRCFEETGESISIPINNIRKDFFFAWYEPYSVNRLKELATQITQNTQAVVEKKNNFYAVKFVNENKPTVLITARQHPGETMASFFIEGFLKKLIDNSTESKELLERFNFQIYPLVNTDGVIKGTHRTDFAGNDYNIKWYSSFIENIEIIKKDLRKDTFLFLDIHGDEVSKINYAYYLRRNIKSKFNHRLFNSLCANYPALIFIPMPSFLRMFLKELLYNKKILLYRRKSYHIEAVDYVVEKTKALSFVVELNAHKNSPEDCIDLGRQLVRAMYLSTSEFLLR